MRVNGVWAVHDDGVVRPILSAMLTGADGSMVKEDFIIDTGADSTILRAELVRRLGLATREPPTHHGLVGIGRVTQYVFVDTSFILERDDGVVVRINGTFVGMTDAATLDTSLLGRDALNNFELVLSKTRDEIAILHRPHYYSIQTSGR